MGAVTYPEPNVASYIEAHFVPVQFNVIEHPEVKVYGMSVEHGHIDVSDSQHKFRVGERLSIIPLHQGMTSNLHDELVAVRNGAVETIWKIAGRGKVR